MNKRRYLKLLLVIFIPLILAGALTAKINLKESKRGEIICRAIDDCFSLTDEQKKYNHHLYRDSDILSHIEFRDLQFPDDGYKFDVSVHPMLIEGVKLSAIPDRNFGAQPQPDNVKLMLGMDTNLALSKQPSPPIPGDHNLVFCNSLLFEKISDTNFKGYCTIGNSHSVFSFFPQGDSYKKLNILKNSVLYEIEKVKTRYRTDFLLISISFLVLFFIISLLAFIVRNLYFFIIK